MISRRFFLSMILVCFAVTALPPLTQAAVPAASATQELASGSALVVDLQNNKVLYSSHPDLVVPIASVTKLMTALVILEARQPMNELLAVNIESVPEMRGVYSRVRLGSKLSREQLLRIMLLASENRAAATLAHYYPGGYDEFVKAMNAQARTLGMTRSHFVEPTGLSAENVSDAEDLVRLLKATLRYPKIGEFSVMPEYTAHFTHPAYTLEFRNTNYLVRKPDWSIQLSKTGFTNLAGHCLVMRTIMDGRPVAMVVLDAFGKYTHMADATRLKRWLETGTLTPVPESALSYKKERERQRQLLMAAPH